MIKLKPVLSVAAILYFGLLVQPVFASSVVLNEIMANPDEGNEWIELFNTTGQLLNLSGWKIIDGNRSVNDDLTLSGFIPPYDFLVFEHSSGWLNNTGDETVTLLDNFNNVLDIIAYNITSKGRTYSRTPDGGTWLANLSPTKNSSNGGQISPSPTPTPTSSPTPSSSPSLTPTPTVSPSVNTPSFTVANIPTQINSDQSFKVSVSLSANNPNAYFKGAFKKTYSSNYFGLTKVLGSWVKNSSNFASQYRGSGNFEMEIKPDTEDSGYLGSGSYLFKVAGYSETGDLTWSNEANINIRSTESQTSPTQTPSQAPQSLTSVNPKSTSSTPKPFKVSTIKIASVAAVATSSTTALSSPNPQVKSNQQINFMRILGILFTISGFAILIYIFVKYRIKSKIL